MPSVSASWARWPPESLPARCAGSRPSRSIRSRGQGVVPARVEPGAEPQVVGDAQPGVRGGVLGDEADLGQLRRAGRRGGRRAPRSCPSSASAGRRRGSAAWSCRRRWGRPARRPGRRGRRACSPTAPSGARTACPGPGPQDGGHAMSSCAAVAKRGHEQRLDALVVEPGPAALASQRCRSWRSGPCAASVASVSVRVTNVPTPGRARPRARRARARGRPSAPCWG